jgi:hypothetical protein
MKIFTEITITTFKVAGLLQENRKLADCLSPIAYKLLCSYLTTAIAMSAKSKNAVCVQTADVPANIQ